MKQKRIFCKRLLTMLLCMAMVFTSVNLPANTLTAQAALTGVEVKVSGAEIKVTLPGNYSSYNIYINDTKEKEKVGPAQYSFAQTQTGEYTVKVVAVIDDAESTDADAIFETTVQITSLKPATPVGLVLSEVSGTAGSVSVAWAPDNAVDHYIVKYGDTTISESMTNGGTIAGFANGTYELSLIAVSAGGEESDPCKATIEVKNGLADDQATIKPSGSSTPENPDDKVATTEDKQELQNLYNTEKAAVDAGNTEGYTEASWNTYTEAVTAAKTVLDNEGATVKQVADALAALQAAKTGLKKESGEVTEATPVNFDNMDNGGSISLYVGGSAGWGNSAASYTTNGESLTVDCTNIGSEGQEWQIQLQLLNKVLKAGEAYTISFDIVANADKNVFFKVGDPNNDGTELAKKAIDLAANTSQKITVTTTAAAADLSSLLVFALGNHGDDSAGSAATVTVSNLTIHSETSGDATGGELTAAEVKETLQTAYNEAKQIVDAGQSNYTQNSWNNFTAAVDAAKVVLDKGDATVSEIKTALANLQAAQKGLKVDTSGISRVVVSEQLEQAFVGADITLPYTANQEDFAFGEDYTVKINGTAADKSKVTVNANALVLDKSLFAAAGVYTIQFEKTDYEITPVYQTVYATDATDKWNLIWNDEFSGDTLDQDKWDYQTGNGSAYGIAGWGNQEEQYYTDSAENTSVGDGVLTITAKKDSSHEGSNYTSARLRTVTEDITDGKADKGTALQAKAYGKIEAKMKMPAGKGIWPAFWMLPYDSEYGTWATSGEIDIMEARGRLPGQVCGTIHYGGVWPNNKYTGKDYFFEDNGTFEDYHIYGIEWDPTEIRWYVDGELYNSISNWYALAGEEGNWPYPAPFDEEFYVLLNLAVGGTFDSSVSSDQIEVDADGVDMNVDYVRWYQRDASVYEGWDITQPEVDKDTSQEATELLKMCDANGNFIKDADFTQMTTTPYTTGDGWTVGEYGKWFPLLIPSNGGGEATWSKVDNEGTNYLKVSVTNAGSQIYSSQMLQYFPVVKGYDYEISYMAYTDSAASKADVGLKIGGDDDNGWSVYSDSYTDTLTTTPTKFTHKFSMTGDTDPTARFEFNLATSTGNVYLSDVAVKITTISESDGEDDAKTPLSDGNHVYNGEFNVGSDSLLYWHWSKNDDATVVKSAKDENGNRVADITVSNDPVIIWQKGLNLLQSDEYQLTYDVNSTEQQQITVALLSADGKEVYASVNQPVSAGNNTLEWKFEQPTGKTDTQAMLKFTFLKSATLDSVVLKRTTNNNVDWDAMEIWPIYNGDFFNGKDGWNIWNEGVGYQTSTIDENGALSMEVTVGKNGTFYCVGVQSSDMTLTKGVPYRVKFDYTLPSAKNYTLELAGEQRNITLEAGTHTYISEPFTGAGNCKFTLYLGPDETAAYNLLLDNIEVYVDPDSLTVPEGYKKPVSLAQDGKSSAKSAAVVKYAEDTTWEAAAKTYYLDGEEIDASKVQIDTANNKLSVDGSYFAAPGTYHFAVKAEGYTRTKAISLTVLEASGNLVVNGDFSKDTQNWELYVADWTAGGSLTVNDDGVAVIEHKYDGGEEWHLQLLQNGLEYGAGDYVLSFDAWADVERPIGVQLQNGNDVLSGTASKVSLGTEKKHYQIALSLTAASGIKLDFPMGSITYEGVTSPNDGEHPHKIYLDNVFLGKASDYAEMRKTTLAAYVAQYENAQQGGNSDESWQALQNALNAAKTVLAKENATEAEIEAAITSMETAIAGLESPQTVDKTELTAEIGKYENLEQGNYTDESWNTFQTALNAAKEVAADANATAEQVAMALAALKSAAEGLTEKQVREGLWVEAIEDQTYTGSAIKPAVKVYSGETELGKKDYKVSYTRNTNVGVATVTVKGKGNYSGQDTTTFNILPKDLGDDDITAAEAVSAVISSKNTVKNPKIAVKYGKKTLSTKKDYTIIWPDIKGEEGTEDAGKPVAGSYTITLEAKEDGNYTGSREIIYDVLPKDTLLMSKAKVKLEETSVVYTGENGEDTVKPQIKEVKIGGKTLNADQYTVEYPEAVQIGKNTLIVHGVEEQGVYGSRAATYTVTGTKLTARNINITNISPENPVYLGEEIELGQLLVVVDKTRPGTEGGEGDTWYTMVENQDYTVSYSKNINAGKAKVTVKGIGAYTGSMSTTFKIEKADLGTWADNADLTWECAESAVYTKTGAVPEFTLSYRGKALTVKKDYTVKLKENKTVGNTASITITGKGNFKGEIKASFTVTAPEAETIYAVASDVIVPAKLTKLKASLKVYEESTGKALKAGTDYDRSFQYFIEENGEERAVTADDLKADTVIGVRITLKNNYAGSDEAAATIETSFRLYKVKASTFKIDSIPAQIYDGTPQEPEIVVKNKVGEILTKDVDYKVTYSNNIKKGTAKVTVTGIGNGYGGTKKASFKIQSADMHFTNNVLQKLSNFFSTLF